MTRMRVRYGLDAASKQLLKGSDGCDLLFYHFPVLLLRLQGGTNLREVLECQILKSEPKQKKSKV